MGYFQGCILLVSLLAATCTGESTQTEYGIIIDAGSAGSRIRVYEWQQTTGSELPKTLTETFQHKVNPGISSFTQNLDALGPYMEELISGVKDNVPAASHSDTSIYLMATAGMRLLMEDRANDVIDKIDSIFSDSTVNPFHYEHTNTRILSGEEEGVFAWICVNYLRGYFNQRVIDMDSVGIMEMGGASTQIAFVPDGSILADKFPVKIAGVNYPLYVHSYLYHGQDYAVKWVMNYLYEQDKGSTHFDYPCFPREAISVEVMDGKNITFKGTGDWDQCHEILNQHIYKAEDDLCYPKPCAIGTTYQPSIGENQKFIAIAVFFYAFDPMVNALEDDGTLVPTKVAAASKVYCNKTIGALETELDRPDDPYLQLYCMEGAYTPILLTKAYGLDNDTRQVQAKNKINDETPEWTIGALIYENERKPERCSDDPNDASMMTISMATLLATLLVLLDNAA